MSYSVFRIQGVKSTNDLKGLYKHNVERISHTNKDIDKTRSNDNIVLIQCNSTYNKKFNNIVAPMKIEHDNRMKTMRADRVKTFDQYVNNSKNDIAFESVFTSDKEFFKNMSKADIKSWAEKSLEFFTKDIGIPEKNIIHAEVHMDEETPHLHIVATPLVKTYNKKRYSEVWSISRRQYIKDKYALSILQDKYNTYMNNCGYKLERGEKGSTKTHTTKAEYLKQKVESAKRDVELAKSVKKGLDLEIKALKSDLEVFSTSRVDIESVDLMKVKKSLLGDKITISERDYNNLLKLAKSGIANKEKITSLAAENKELNETLSRFRNSEYNARQENLNIKMELNNFKSKYSKVVKEHNAMYKVCEKHNVFDEVKKELNPVSKKVLNKNMDFER